MKKLQQTQEQFHAANARKKEPLLERFQQMENDFNEYHATLAPLLAQQACNTTMLQADAGSVAALTGGLRSMAV